MLALPLRPERGVIGPGRSEDFPDRGQLQVLRDSSPPPNPLSRRAFIVGAGLGAVAHSAPRLLGSEFLTGAMRKWDLSILENRYFDGGDGSPEQLKLKYTPEETAQVVDEIGLDIELTVRKVGHISPQRIPDELPDMVAALARRNRRISYLAMDVVRPDEPHWRNAVRLAKSLGISRYRHRGFQYDLTKPRKAQIPAFTSMARVFAAANKEMGVQAVYQTHSGPKMAGGASWDLDLILDDIDPRYFGVAIDTDHVMVEEGLAWPNAIDVLAPRTVAMCVKSFRWDYDRKVGKYRPIPVPLGQGYVTKDFVQQVIAAHGGPLPIIIHHECYLNAQGEQAAVPFAQRRALVEAFRSDAAVLRGWLRG